MTRYLLITLCLLTSCAPLGWAAIAGVGVGAGVAVVSPQPSGSAP
jgi:hypothetical protein